MGARKVDGKPGFDFAKSRNQLLIVEAIRVVFLLAILVVSLTFQSAQPEFINLELLIPIYCILAIQLFLNSIYLFFFDRSVRIWQATAFLFAIETLSISSLIYFSGVNQSIFLFLYLVNIILAGFVFQRRGAIFISLLTSVAFSLLVIFGPEMHGQTLVFSIVLNNLAFFAVAGLSGFLSEQLNFMGSELKDRVRSLAALQNLNELIVRYMPTGLITVDSKGQILLLNHASREILGLETHSGKKMYIELEQLLPGIWSKIQEKRVERFDWQYRSPSQDRLTLEVTASALENEAGQINGFVLTFQDSTKIRRLEFAMRQSEKLAAVGQLAAGIAHEIRNPLASISGSIELLEGMLPVPKDAEERKLMRIVLKEIDRLNGLISEFLVYVRPDQLKDDPVDLTGLIKEILEQVSLDKNLRKDVGQKLDLGQEMIVTGDRAKLKQALLNVVINAFQAMTECEKPELLITLGKKGNSIILKIKDSGAGIEETRLRKIFEPFHTTKPRGTGLGLAVTHKIIENHSGKIFVESTLGLGTEFSFEFPIRTPKEVVKNPLVSEENGLEFRVLASDDLKDNLKRGSG